VSTQRTNKAELSPERIARLDAIGFVWDQITQQWEEGFAALARFKEREGHCSVKRGHKEDGYNLDSWAKFQRGNKESLTNERRQRLDEIGFVWEPRTQQWEEGFAALVQFYEREGHCSVKRGHTEGDYRLGGWVNKQRARKDALSPERRQRLEEMGLVWGTRVAPSTDN